MSRIARLETFANQHVCFVRLTTDAGEVGWGPQTARPRPIGEGAGWAPGLNLAGVCLRQENRYGSARVSTFCKICTPSS